MVRRCSPLIAAALTSSLALGCSDPEDKVYPDCPYDSGYWHEDTGTKPDSDGDGDGDDTGDTDPTETGSDDTGGDDTGSDDTGSGDTGEPAPLYGNAASDDFVQGSWGTVILSSNPDRANLFSCDPETGWKAVDAVATADAMQATNQNIVLTGVPNPEYSTEDCQWQNAERLALELAGRDASISVMTSLRDDLSFEEYQQAIRGTRTVQAASGNVLGVNIDDANEAFSAPWRPLNVSRVTLEEAASLHALANSTTEPGAPVGFMPYFPAEAFPYALADDGFVMGARACNSATCPLSDGTEVAGAHFYIFQDDLIEVTGRFNPGEVSPDTPHTISMLMVDGLRGGDYPYTFEVVFEVNGTEVGRYSATDPGHSTRYFDVVELEVEGLIPSADNTFRAWIDTGDTNVTQYGRRIIYAWDGRLHHPDGSETRLGLTDLAGNIERAPHPSGTAHSLEPLLAGPNTPWNVREHVDGTAFKFASRSNYYDAELHARVAESICRDFKARDQPCFEVFWANDQWTGDVNGTPGNPSLVEYLRTAQDHTDGIIAWMLQHNMADRSKGPWASRDPWEADYQVAAGLAGETKSIPGWNHAWTVSAPESGEYTLHWDIDKSVGAGIFEKAIRVDDAAVFTEDLTAESDPLHAFEVSAGAEIAVQLNQIAGYGFAWLAAQFKLVGPSGEPVDLSAGVHTSGVSAATEGLYTCFTTYFTSHDHEDACEPGPAE